MSEKYKLIYFPLRGLAEPIRFVLAYLKADYEDFRIDFQDWPNVKSKAPFGKLPYFEIDGKVVTQSIALTRYFGRQAGIAGSTLWEDLMIDMAVDIFRDFLLEFNYWITEEDETVRAKKKEKLVNEIPFYMGKLDNHVKENGGYLANNKLSWGDLYFVSVIEFLGETIGVETYSPYPHLKRLFDKVTNLPSIKSWIERRPKDEPNIFNKD